MVIFVPWFNNQLKHDETYGDVWLIDVALSYHGKKPQNGVFLSGKLFWMNRRIWGFPKLANITSTVANIHWLTCRKMQKHKIDLGMFKYLVNTWLNIWLIPMTWVYTNMVCYQRPSGDYLVGGVQYCSFLAFLKRDGDPQWRAYVSGAWNHHPDQERWIFWIWLPYGLLWCFWGSIWVNIRTLKVKPT